MLTPAVRSAAKNTACELGYLLSSPATPDLIKAYEVGYCRGFQARPHRTPYPVPLNQQQQRLLGPYLAEQVEVYHPATGCYGLLKGLPFALTPGCDVVAEVEWYGSPEAVAEGTSGEVYSRPGVLLPVLCSFSVLGEQANSFRVDATAHAAMMALAVALQGGGAVTEIVEAHYSEGNGRSRIWLEYEDEDGDYCDAYVWDDGSAQDGNEEAFQLIDYLRQAGFAVGLRADQYQRRVAGHDYRTGAPQVREEVARG